MPQAALQELLGLAGIEGEATIAGADPVLQTPYRVGAAGAAALAATGIAAAQLWQLRGGRGQRVAVDLRAGMVGASARGGGGGTAAAGARAHRRCATDAAAESGAAACMS